MYKSKPQELCQQKKCQIPNYKTHKQKLDHNPRLQSTIIIDDISFCSPFLFGSNKDAQNDATKVTYDHFFPAQPLSLPSSFNSPRPPRLPNLHPPPQSFLSFEAIDKEVSGLRSTLECVSNYSSEKKKAERRYSLPNFHAVSTSLTMDSHLRRVELDTTSDMPLSS